MIVLARRLAELLVACAATAAVCPVATAAAAPRSLASAPRPARVCGPTGVRAPKVGAAPLADATAARRVCRASNEARPDNSADNRRTPTAVQLRAFRAQNHNPYTRYVDGRFRGTTDEIIQWAAAKWRLSADLLRAVAAVESWWHMSTLGDNGDSFGLFQVRRPYHCQEPVCDQFRHDTALNADYYGSVIRSYYDGRQTWLNTVSGNGRAYAAGDLWGAVGAWFSGRWHDPGAESYVAHVRSDLTARVWTQRYFAGR